MLMIMVRSTIILLIRYPCDDLVHNDDENDGGEDDEKL